MREQSTEADFSVKVALQGASPRTNPTGTRRPEQPPALRAGQRHGRGQEKCSGSPEAGESTPAQGILGRLPGEVVSEWVLQVAMAGNVFSHGCSLNAVGECGTWHSHLQMCWEVGLSQTHPLTCQSVAGTQPRACPLSQSRGSTDPPQGMSACPSSGWRHLLVPQIKRASILLCDQTVFAALLALPVLPKEVSS